MKSLESLLVLFALALPNAACAGSRWHHVVLINIASKILHFQELPSGKAAQDALRQHGPDAKMNVTLSRCK